MQKLLSESQLLVVIIKRFCPRYPNGLTKNVKERSEETKTTGVFAKGKGEPVKFCEDKPKKQSRTKAQKLSVEAKKHIQLWRRRPDSSYGGAVPTRAIGSPAKAFSQRVRLPDYP